MSQNKISVASISISGQLSLQTHALNNEGTEGNQSFARQYFVVLKGMNEPESVSGISGDTFKHVQAEHLYRICLDGNLSLSVGAKQFHPNRVGWDIESGALKLITAESLGPDTDTILQLCSVSDLEGYMITVKGGQTLRRDSIIEFGTLLGIPTQVRTKSHFHAKHGNTSDNPMPFNQEVSSGMYAVIAHLEAHRIGYNPHSLKYAIAPAKRQERLQAMLKSLLYAYLEPNGAKRATYLPHIDAFSGTIAVSSKLSCPAPMLSALNENYTLEIERIANRFNQIEGAEVIRLLSFETVSEFATEMQVLIKSAEPWEDPHAR